MAYKHTVKQGETVNGIAQSLGFRDHNAAGISGVSNLDQIKPGDVLEISNYTPGQVPSVGSSPAVVSSKDVSGAFNTNSSKLDTKVDGLASTTGGTTSTGEVAKGEDGKPLVQVDRLAKGKLGTQTPEAGLTGDPIYDSLELWEDKRRKDEEKKTAQQKREYENLFKTAFGAVDATYRATVQNVNTTFDARLNEQRRINDLNISRTRAYGLAGGGALAAPIEYTNAVSQREQEGAAKIKQLDNERNALIAAAMAARDTGKAKLLQDKMTALDQIETRLRNTMKDIVEESQRQYNMLVNIRKDQEAKQAEQAKALLAAAAISYEGDFFNAKDNSEKDKIIKKVVAESGGMIDYATALGEFAARAKAKKEAEDEEKKLAADLALKGAQAGAASASAAASWALAAKRKKETEYVGRGGSSGGGKSDVFMAINARLGVGEDGKPLRNPETGVPYTYNGMLTAQGFRDLVNAAGENGVDRQTFLDQYAGYLDPASYAAYGLTKTEQANIGNLGKMDPVYAGMEDDAEDEEE